MYEFVFFLDSCYSQYYLINLSVSTDNFCLFCLSTAVIDMPQMWIESYESVRIKWRKYDSTKYSTLKASHGYLKRIVTKLLSYRIFATWF